MAYNARMATLRRILKYTPAVVLGLLVVAWALSLFGRLVLYGGNLPPIALGVKDGNLVLGTGMLAAHLPVPRQRWFSYRSRPTLCDRPGGSFLYNPHPCGRAIQNLWLEVPITWLLTLQLPLAIGPFVSFRFRLWQYLAYTALVAVELAYYLRWQE
jgi:hypothetical protein